MDSRTTLLKGLKQQQQGKYIEAERAYLRVLEREPRNPDALHLLGTVYLTLGRPDKAASCIRQSITLNPRFAPAHANLGAALRACGDPRAAVESCERALALNPGDAATWSNLANALTQLGQVEQALAAYERAIAINPGFLDAYLNRGVLLEDLGRNEAALGSYEQGLASCGKDARLLSRRAVVLVALRRFDEARSEVQSLPASPGVVPEVLTTCALAFERQGERDEAIRLYSRALKMSSSNLEALVGLAKLRSQEGRFDEALSFARRAIAGYPNVAEAHLAIAAVERERLNQTAALESCERALALSPGFSKAHVLRGTILSDLGRWPDSLAALDVALRLGSRDAAVYVAHGVAAECCNQLSTAVDDLTRALELETDLPYAASNLIVVKLRLSDWSTYEEDLRRVQLDARQYPFASLTTVDDPALHLSVARTLDSFLRGVESSVSHVAPVRELRPLRIGWLSPDFGEHPVTRALVDLLERHDRDVFHMTGFSLGVDDGSLARQRIARAFDKFIDVRGMGDVAKASCIRQEQIDILIDLTGYTRGCRPEVFKQRPAPLQVAFLGYPGTMGSGAIDYLIADRFVIPATVEEHYDEKLALLPGCFMPYDTTRMVDSAGLTRAQCNLPEAGIVFCCFNTAFKINPPVFDVWTRLLLDIPGSVLWLRHGGDQQASNLRREAQRRGVDPERLVFARRVDPDSAYLAQYRLADLFLDTFPYNAHQTTCDALWAGLPVVTCAGSSFASRVAGSALHYANLSDLVTASLTEYEDLARALASDPARLAAVRARVESTRRSPLFDMERYCRDFEATLRHIWDLHVAGERPRTFATAPTNEIVI